MSINPFDNIPSDVVAALSALTSGADASAEYGMSRVRRWWGYVDKTDARYIKQCLITPELKFDDEFKYFDANGQEQKTRAIRVQFNYTLLLDDDTTHEQEGDPMLITYCELNTLPEGKDSGGPRVRARMMNDRLATCCAALLGVDPSGWKAAYSGKGGWLGILREIYNRHLQLKASGSHLHAEVEFTIQNRKYKDKKTGEEKTTVNGTDVIRKLISGTA